MLHVVLYQPLIPPNTGNIGRLCVGLDAHLHLIKPLGFELTEQAFRRAIAIGIGRVDEVDPQIEGLVQAGDGLLALDTDTEGQPGAKRDFRNGQIAVPELPVLHGLKPLDHDGCGACPRPPVFGDRPVFRPLQEGARRAVGRQGGHAAVSPRVRHLLAIVF